MSFHVFPDPTIAPLPPAGPFAAGAAGAAGDTSPYQAVAELTGLPVSGGTPSFFVRVAIGGRGGGGAGRLPARDQHEHRHERGGRNHRGEQWR